MEEKTEVRETLSEGVLTHVKHGFTPTSWRKTLGQVKYIAHTLIGRHTHKSPHTAYS